MEDTKATETLTREMELTRLEMAALTDSLNRLNHTMNGTAVETNRLASLIEDATQRGFWKRFLG